jgi:hypothetical protein
MTMIEVKTDRTHTPLAVGASEAARMLNVSRPTLWR